MSTRSRTPARFTGTVRIVVLAFLALAAVSCSGGGPRQDSVLLITLDTLRADHVGCYGDSPAATPVLDSLAARGAMVREVWSPVPLTTPAHATILTGLYPMAHGVRNNARFRLPEDVTTLAEMIASPERNSAAFVGSFTTSRIFGLAQGFQGYYDDMGHEPGGAQRSARRGDEVVDQAASWLEKFSDGPFFVWVHLYDPHTPYDPPPPYDRQYPRDPYSGEVAFTDAQVGVLLEALERAGATSRTVVAVVGDHGEGLGDHGEPEHGYLLYEEMVKVPLILAAPGAIEEGTVLDGPASTTDLVPTLLALLGEESPVAIHGVNLLAPEIRDEVRPVYAETLYPYEEQGWSALYALRIGDLKYIESPAPELYDLSVDPDESDDLSVDRADYAETMRGELHAMAADLVDESRLSTAVGLGGDMVDDETIARLEGLGYLGGGGGVDDPSGSEAMPAVGGRNPRDAMGDLVRFLEAQDLFAERRYRAAVRTFEDLVRNEPGNPQFRLKLAQAYLMAERPSAAERQYRDLVEKHPTFYLGYRSFSDFLEGRGRPTESRDLWMQLLEILPGYVGIEVRIARAENAAGLYGDAENRMRAYLAQRAEDAEGWVQLGRAFGGRQVALEALKAFLHALEIRPTEKTAVQEAVRILVASGKADDARDLVRKLLVRAPGDPHLLRVQSRLQNL